MATFQLPGKIFIFMYENIENQFSWCKNISIVSIKFSSFFLLGKGVSKPIRELFSLFLWHNPSLYTSLFIFFSSYHMYCFGYGSNKGKTKSVQSDI